MNPYLAKRCEDRNKPQTEATIGQSETQIAEEGDDYELDEYDMDNYSDCPLLVDTQYDESYRQA